MRRQLALGAYGEQVAAAHLERAGMQILDRNWRCRHGEIDIVARDGGVLVVCEVKTRSSLAFGHPAEAVSPRKLRRLRHLVYRWLDEHEYFAPEVRIDVVSVVQRDSGPPVVQHIPGVG